MSERGSRRPRTRGPVAMCESQVAPSPPGSQRQASFSFGQQHAGEGGLGLGCGGSKPARSGQAEVKAVTSLVARGLGPSAAQLC